MAPAWYSLQKSMSSERSFISIHRNLQQKILLKGVQSITYLSMTSEKFLLSLVAAKLFLPQKQKRQGMTLKIHD